MARPTTQADLLQAAQEKFQTMNDLIDRMSPQVQQAPFAFGDAFAQKEAHWKRDKNLRDVLIHLYEWHQLLLNWVAAAQKGAPTSFLPPPYNWKNYGDLNVMFWEKHQQTSLPAAKEMLQTSHKQVIQLIQSFDNEALFAKGALAWTGTSTLGSYCVSATASHYDWAIKKIKAHSKTCKLA